MGTGTKGTMKVVPASLIVTLATSMVASGVRRQRRRCAERRIERRERLERGSGRRPAEDVVLILYPLR